MTPNFLNLIIITFPNSYELGETVRKFYYFYKSNIGSMDIESIEKEFTKLYLTKK